METIDYLDRKASSLARLFFSNNQNPIMIVGLEGEDSHPITKSYEYLGFVPDFFSRYNSRKIQPNEIIFDLETKDSAVLEAFKKVLLSRGFNFSVWDTTNRGYHIHLTFDECKRMELAERKKAKLIFMKKIVSIVEREHNLKINENNLVDYGKLDNQQILIKYSKHRKTGGYKVLVEEYNNGKRNTLPIVCKSELQ